MQKTAETIFKKAIYVQTQEDRFTWPDYQRDNGIRSVRQKSLELSSFAAY